MQRKIDIEDLRNLQEKRKLRKTMDLKRATLAVDQFISVARRLTDVKVPSFHRRSWQRADVMAVGVDGRMMELRLSHVAASLSSMC